jgi:[ribosomal protein S18]-alanine N-acetyltransferase
MGSTCGMTVTIRDISGDDLPVLERLMMDSFDPIFGEAWSVHDLASTLNLPGVRARLALSADDAHGFCLTYHLPYEAELLMVAVAPAMRRHGIARHLVEDAANTARAAKLQALFLEVREDNMAARALYASRGFQVIGRRKDYYKGQDKVLRPAVTLRLPLLPITL